MGIEMVTNSLNYFQAAEEHFRRARGTAFFLLSPRDLALVQAWRDAGIPIEAVLRGIDRTFDNRRRGFSRERNQNVNSLAYCCQAIAAEAHALANAITLMPKSTNPPFTIEDVRGFISRNVMILMKTGMPEFAAALETLDVDALYSDLETLEHHLVAIEENMVVQLRAAATENVVTEINAALERDLRPYRGKMTTDQLAMLERQFVERRLMELAGLPRLSLFYL